MKYDVGNIMRYNVQNCNLTRSSRCGIMEPRNRNTITIIRRNNHEYKFSESKQGGS